VIKGKERLENEMEGSSRRPGVLGEWRQREGRQKAMLDPSF